MEEDQVKDQIQEAEPIDTSLIQGQESKEPFTRIGAEDSSVKKEEDSTPTAIESKAVEEQKEPQSKVVEEQKEPEVTREELITTLKSKNKEIKRNEKKVKTLEDAYKGAVKTRKLLAADRQALVAFIEIMLRGQKGIEQIGKIKTGDLKTDDLVKMYDYPKLVQQPNNSLESKMQKLQNQLQSVVQKLDQKEKEILKLEQENSNLKAEHILKFFKSTTIQPDAEQALQLQKKMSSQTNEILKLNDQVREQKQKILELETKLQLVGTEKLMELEEQKGERLPSARQSKIQRELESDEDSELHTDRQEIEQKNRSLQKSLGSTVEELNNLKVKMAQLSYVQEKRTIRPENSQDGYFFDLDDNLPKLKKYEQKIRDLESLIKMQMESEKIMRQRVNQLEKSASYENINITYLKNIILKYMEYLAQKNFKEAETLEYVIFTVLQCDRDDLKRLSGFRQTNQSGILGFIKSKFGTLKPPNNKRQENYSDSLTNRSHLDGLSQSVMHTARHTSQNSFRLNQSYDMAHTERGRGGKESDSIFQD